MFPRVTLLVATGLVLAAGCSGRSPQAPILVGHVAALSGPGGEAGERAARGIRLAVIDANKHAAAEGGRPVNVLHTDTRGRPEAFEGEAVRLAAVNRVAGLLGGTTPAEVERLEKARLTVVSPSGDRTRAMGDSVFLTGPTPEQRGQVLALFAAERLTPAPPPAKAAAARAGVLAALPGAGPLGAGALAHACNPAPRTLVLADARGDENVRLAESFARGLPPAANPWRFVGKGEAGTPAECVVPVGPWRYASDAELASLLRQAKDAQPDAVLLAGSGAALREVRRQLSGVPVLFGGGADALKELQAHDGALEGVYLPAAFVTDSDATAARDFIGRYRKAYGEDPDAHAALAYEGGRLLFEAIRQVDAAHSRPRVRERMAALKDFPGLFGLLTVGSDGTVRRPLFVVRLEAGRPVTQARYDPLGDKAGK